MSSAFGVNLNIIQVLVNNFDVPAKISRTVTTCVDALFTDVISGSPDGEYGTYFENIVKTTSNASFSGVRETAIKNVPTIMAREGF